VGIKLGRFADKIAGFAEDVSVGFKLNSLKPMSYNQVSTYLSCPLKYRFSYLRTADAEVEAGVSKAGGLAFYGVLTRVLKGAYSSGRLAPLEDILGQYEKFWVSSDFSDKSEEAEYFEEGKKILAGFHAATSGEKGTVAMVTGWKDKTKKFLALEQRVYVDVGGVRMSEKIDRIMALPDGSYESVIYRLSRPWGNDARPALFLQAAKKLLPFRRHRIAYYYLRENKKAVCDVTGDTAVRLEESARRSAKGILKNDFPPCKGAWCGFCNFRKSCYVWEKFPQDKSRTRISFSKLNSFLSCPRSYRFVYVDKIKLKPHWFFSLGSSVHEAFEKFYCYDGVFSAPGKGLLLKMLKSSWNSAGYAEDGVDEKEYYAKASKMIEDYYDTFVAGRKFKNAYKIEEYFELPVGGKALLNGYIDRIDELDDGTYEIIDYKTEPNWPDERVMNEHKLQLALYWWACKEGGLTPVPPAKLSLFMLNFNKKISFLVNTGPAVGREDVLDINGLIEENVDRIDSIVDLMRTAASEYKSGRPADEVFKPKTNSYCGNCDFRMDCPLFVM
jgi:RecB family exonuclease